MTVVLTNLVRLVGDLDRHVQDTRHLFEIVHRFGNTAVPASLVEGPVVREPPPPSADRTKGALVREHLLTVGGRRIPLRP